MTPAALATLVTAALAIYVFRRPPPPPLWPSVPCVIGGGFLFSIGELVSSLATDTAQAWAGAYLLYGGVILVGPSIWTMALRFAEAHQQPFRFGRSRWARVPAWLGFVLLVSLLTSPLHGMLLTPRVGERNDFHLLWYVIAIENWAVVAASVGLFLRTARRTSSRRVRGQVYLMAAGCLAPLPLNLIYVSLPNSLPADPTSLGLAAAGLLFVSGIYRQQLFSLSPVAFWEALRQDSDAVLVLDPQRRLLFANPVAHHLLTGVPLVPGEPPLPGFVRKLQHDALARTRLDADALLDGAGDGTGHVCRFTAPPGRWLRIEVVPLVGTGGRSSGYCVRIRDEPPLKNAHDAMAAQAAALASVLGATDDAFVVTNLDGAVLYSNQRLEDMFGLAPVSRGDDSEALSRVIAEQLRETGNSNERVEQAFRRPAETYQAEIVTHDGRQLEWGYYPLLDDERLTGRVWQLRDVTVQRRAANELLESQKTESLGVIAGGVAHDFNNLLAVIQGNAALARRDAPPDLGIDRFLSDIEIASDRASDLTEQLLAYAGKSNIRIEEHDLSRLVADVRQLIDVSIPKRVELICDLPSGLPPVEADATQLHQVIMNLVLNAAESLAEKSGSVRVRTGVKILSDQEAASMPVGNPNPGRFVFLEVEDTGSGIGKDRLTRIFEPFYSTKFAGRGLGLAATMGVLRTHHGGLHVRSTPGKGSIFTAFLPVNTDGQHPKL